jgi:hypothetical protein
LLDSTQRPRDCGKIVSMMRPPLLLAILIYISLDLSLPGMPGAFVFEPAESIESSHSRVRGTGETMVLPAALSETVVLSELDFGDRRAPSMIATERREPLPRQLPRSLVGSARPSEDPY